MKHDLARFPGPVGSLTPGIKNLFTGDDSCVIRTVYTFYREEPEVHLLTTESGSSLTVPAGERVVVSGTMNMAPENVVTV
ncbi:MAG: hypothetical protein QHH04_03030 [Methanolinea sp.]|jgi:hypothetical protein|nr:hypothetical protein [Methanolinea sp.]